MKSTKIIAVDVGNTTVSIAWMRGERVVKSKKILTHLVDRKIIVKTLSAAKDWPIVVSSVVPAINTFFRRLGMRVYIAGKDIDIPIKNLYDSQSAGMDRLVGAWAAICLYPRTRLVIDFGTAITVDFISSRGEYQGGIILPGIGSTQRVLANCALLPKKIVYRPTSAKIPTNTIDSISQGTAVGFSCMINGVVAKYTADLGINKNIPVILTGGEAPVLLEHLNFPGIYMPHLIFYGLYELYRQSC